MATKKSSKTDKHLLRDSDRKRAIVLARRYLERGPYPMEIEGEIYTCPISGEELAFALLELAKHGTFDTPANLAVRNLQIRGHVRRVAAERDISVEAAIGHTAEDYGASAMKRSAITGDTSRRSDRNRPRPHGGVFVCAVRDRARVARGRGAGRVTA